MKLIGLFITKPNPFSSIAVTVGYFLNLFSHLQQKLKDDVEILSPQVEEFLQSSNDLLEEYELAVTEMRRIEKERESLKRRWNKLKSDANSREPRFVDCSPPIYIKGRKMSFYLT
mgnify:FL=1